MSIKNFICVFSLSLFLSLVGGDDDRCQYWPVKRELENKQKGESKRKLFDLIRLKNEHLILYLNSVMNENFRLFFKLFEALTLLHRPNIYEPIHIDGQKDSQIFANLFVNLCESFVNRFANIRLCTVWLRIKVSARLFFGFL